MLSKKEASVAEKKENRGMAVVFHSGTYDRVYNGLAVALSAVAMSRPVRLLFTYWSLNHLRRDQTGPLPLDREADRSLVEGHIESGKMKSIQELLGDAKSLGAKIYACEGSMTLLELHANELIDEVDETTGRVLFLEHAKEDQLLFV